jgi:creatinine amidohydrolase
MGADRDRRRTNGVYEWETAWGLAMSEVEWARLKAHELRALADQDAVAIVPVAAIEQHGPHLPVMVDTRLAGEVGRRAALKGTEAGTPTVVLPVIWHGLSEHHMPYGGTVTLDTQAFHLVLRGVVDSVARHGFSKVLILNGHGGNIIASQVSAQDLTLELGIPVIAATYWLEAASGFAEILEVQDNVMHACEAETSMMMALDPELVDDRDLASVKGPIGVKFLQAGEGAYRWRSLTHVTANGVIGDPTTASPEKGERLLDAAADAIVALVSKPDTFARQDDVRPNAVGGVPFRRD